MIRVGILTVLVSLLFAVTTSQLSAQYYWGPRSPGTAFSANARGMGSLIRDQGEANVLNAQAAGSLEDARSKYIQNRVDAVQAYYDRKRIRAAYYADIKEANKDRLDRYVARKGTIPQLSQDDIDASTGTITWPTLLQIAEYDDFRKPYEELFQKYFTSGTLSGAEIMKAQQISREWRQQIGADRKEFGDDRARQAIRFILSLDKELVRS